MMGQKASKSISNDTKGFFQGSERYAVVGASANRMKFGNKVLISYMDAGLEVVPVHPTLEEIEDLKVQQLEQLENPETYGVSIVTPPGVSMSVIEQGQKLGFKRFWLQPGAESKEILSKEWGEDVQVIAGGPCVLVSIDRGEHKSKL